MAAEWEDSRGFLDEGVCANLMVCKKLEWAIEWFESEGQKALVEHGLHCACGWRRVEEGNHRFWDARTPILKKPIAGTAFQDEEIA
jgi:hypothetical protein